MSNIKIPTLEEKVKIYEDFLHRINLYIVCGNNDGIRQLIQNADAWSYSWRQGNGELSDEEQDQLIASKFWKLLEVNKL
jgi:hypothetical protein